MAVSDADIDRIRKHLGYPARDNYPLFVLTIINDTIPNAANNLTPQGEVELGKILTTMDDIEAQLQLASKVMVATKVGSIGIDGQNADKLWVEYVKWAKKLALLLRVTLNPDLEELAGTSVNAKVVY
jgi:hypothetical protein